MAFNAWNLFDDEEEARRWVSQQMVAPSAGSRQWLLSQVGVHLCGLPVDRVVQMVQSSHVTPIPHLSAVAGLFNLQGEVIPVVDLRQRFAQPAAAGGVRSVLVIVRVVHDAAQAEGTEGGKLVGLQVDAVVDLVFLPAEAMRPLEAVGVAVAGRAILSGMARHCGEEIHLVDIEAVLSREEVLAAMTGRN